MPKQRILYIDILKLFTIYLVIWGHAIMHFQPDYRQSYIFQTIYAFHMPLFMMLSGYFAFSSMVLEPRGFFLKKFRQLLLPCLSWGILCWLFITSGLIEGKFHLNIKELFTAGWIGLFDNFWFLKSCFICYTLSWLCYRCGRYKIMAMAVAWVLCAMQGRFHLNIMFPSFLLGLYLRQSTWLSNGLKQYRYTLYATFFVFLSVNFLLPLKDYYVYKLMLGISGALSCFVLFKTTVGTLQTTSLLESFAKVGGATLGIYVIQAILLEFLMPRYISFAAIPMPVLILLMPLFSLVILLIIYTIVQLISRPNVLGWLMLGHPLKK